MQILALSLGCLCLSSTCLAQTWIQAQPTTSPAARWSHGTAYDPATGHTIVFGGSSAKNNFLNDTWAYDGKTWTQLKPNTSPAGRRLQTMVHAGTRTVLFGGASSAGYLADTWVFDGKDWRQVTTTNAPSRRGIAAMAYDAARKRVVLFGGINTSGFQSDTWEFDFSTWRRVSSRGGPSARYSYMTYDAARKRVVLFGGTGSAFFNDTWEYDGKRWTQATPATKPPAREGVAIAYDTARRRTVIFGGTGVGGAYFNDTWEYDGKDWMLMKPATQPSSRQDSDGMVYDSRRQRIVLFGGLTPNGNPREAGDTWEYVGPQSFTASPSTVSIATGGTQTFSLDAGPAQAKRLYWIFGSVTGTSPGVTLISPAGSVNISLNPDFWTDITIGLANSPLLAKSKGTLGATGTAISTFHVPKIASSSAIGVKFFHAYLVYDAKSNFYMASNPVELTLVK